MEDEYNEITSDESDDDKTCPLCMEVLEETDRNLYPCSCGYQVCLWCLHYIRTTMGNKCPACRRDYDESNFKYMTKTRSNTSRVSGVKKKRGRLDKDSSCKDDKGDTPNNNSESLKDVRVIQRNLVYVVGIPLKLAKKEILKKHEYFGQYGRIQHIVINKSNTYNSHWGGSSYTAYITYSKNTEASAAIQGINSMQTESKFLRASYGTTKYCSYFLKGMKCCNTDCFYLHEYGDEHDRYTKDMGFTKYPLPSNNDTSQQSIKNKDVTTYQSTDGNSPMKLLNLLQRSNKLINIRDNTSSIYNGDTSNQDKSWANVAAGNNRFDVQQKLLINPTPILSTKSNNITHIINHSMLTIHSGSST